MSPGFSRLGGYFILMFCKYMLYRLHCCFFAGTPQAMDEYSAKMPSFMRDCCEQVFGTLYEHKLGPHCKLFQSTLGDGLWLCGETAYKVVWCEVVKVGRWHGDVCVCVWRLHSSLLLNH